MFLQKFSSVTSGKSLLFFQGLWSPNVEVESADHAVLQYYFHAKLYIFCSFVVYLKLTLAAKLEANAQ